MKQTITLQGSKGKLAGTLYLPLSNTSLDAPEPAHLVILMHGFMAWQHIPPIPALATRLQQQGLAVLTFDFNGHGRSDGKFRDMTVENELDDARLVYHQVRKWSWVCRIALAGHSQGGVVAGLLAGELGAELITSVVQLAPAAVLHDDALEGHIMNAKFDPDHLPEYVRVFFFKKVGRAYFEVAQKIDIYGCSCRYAGPVCLIHGTDDTVVPFAYSERYYNEYPYASLILLDGETHMLNKKREDVIQTATEFLTSTLNR